MKIRCRFCYPRIEFGLDEGISIRDIRDVKNETRGDVANMLAKVYEMWE